MQQGHPGIHEKEDAWQGSLSVRLTASQAVPYSSKVEQWPGDERTEMVIKHKMAFITGSSVVWIKFKDSKKKKNLLNAKGKVRKQTLLQTQMISNQ